MGLRFAVVLVAASAVFAQEWPAWHGGAENTKYSSLKQINKDNAGRLALAWQYDTGDAGEGTEIQCNPLVIGGTLYATTPKLRVIALDAATGRLKWRFDPNQTPFTGRTRNRGLSYWQSGKDRRLFFGWKNWLYAINADTGKPVPGFGTEGRVDLSKDLGRDTTGQLAGLNTPGIVYKDLLIVGSIVSEDLPAAPGHIRAYDVRTGKLRWIFHTIPQPGEPGIETWPKGAHVYAGGVNNWAGMALDAQRGIVYAPTGSASFDFYGANRVGDDLYANTLLALDAATGRKLWHFQIVRHDVWDRDLPAAPTLVTVKRNGKTIDAVAQITKNGYVWVFDRVTGEPLFPWENRAVPASDIEGEVLAKTQPLPLKPEPFARQQFTEDIATNRTPEARAAVIARLRTLRSGPQFTPPSREGTVILPGFDGGGEWGGGTYDPETGLFYVNANESAWILKIVPKRAAGAMSGRTLYNRNCASCHHRDMTGTPPEFPSLVNLSARRSEQQVSEVVHKGAGRMPGFAYLKEPALDAILRYILRGEDKEVAAGEAPAPSPIDQKYTFDGYTRFADPDGYPALSPPWGTLNAIDLNTGEYAWKIPFGEFPALAAKGAPVTGTENYGGSVVTAGGLLFIGATNADRKFHAYDKRTGRLLWEYTMNAAGNATPATYEVNGKQFVVIAAGGGKFGNASGGSYYAFALPDAR